VLDGSLLSETALVPAAYVSAALSAPFHGKLHLFHMVHPLSCVDENVIDRLPYIQESMIARARENLSNVLHMIEVSELQQLHLDISATVAQGPEIGQTLVSVAEAGDDAIALAMHGRRGVSRYLAENVAEQLLKKTHLPLLVVIELFVGDTSLFGRRIVMSGELIDILIDDACRPARRSLQRHPLLFWHLLLLSGFALLIGIWIVRGQWLAPWNNDAWFAGLCIALVVLLLGTIASAALRGYHLYRDLWVKSSLWSMIALFVGFTSLAFLHVG
jgi:nucleotide-binding universal stress UspA family protein